MYGRNLLSALMEAVADTPVIFLQGARQSGKSTLVESVIRQLDARYLTFDDTTLLAAAQKDPAGFVSGLTGTVILDEVQRVPELLLPIKAEVDKNRTPGHFILTGSANVLVLPQVADILTGRMEVLTLWPLSRGELRGRREDFIHSVFKPKLPEQALEAISHTALREWVLKGGFPEVLTRPSERRRAAWFNSYITTLVQRDIRDISSVQGLSEFPGLLSLLATRAANLVNFSEIGRTVGLPQTSLKRYISLLEATFILKLLPAWHANLGKRLVKAPKLLLTDVGLTAHLMGVDAKGVLFDGNQWGRLLEDFVATELLRQLGWSQKRAELSHFRTQTGQEVDLVLEDPSGKIVGIEVKATATIRARDLRGLELLAESTGERFVRGIVLYTGTEIVPFSEKLYAVPIPALWCW